MPFSTVPETKRLISADLLFGFSCIVGPSRKIMEVDGKNTCSITSDYVK